VHTVQLSIASLVSKVEAGTVRLPEIQRAYVWKATQVAGLLDSLYRGYPSGSLLLWETDEPVTEHDMAVSSSPGLLVEKPQYLLDGQQRLTSLHRLFQGHPDTTVVFHVESQRFQSASAATGKDARWVPVTPVLNATLNLFGAVKSIVQRYPELDEQTVYDRLHRVAQVGKYLYFVEIVEDMAYEEVAEIFVRVNSRGRHLGKADLAMATLTARWRGISQNFTEEHNRWSKEGYLDIDTPFLARCLAAIATESRMLKGLVDTPLEQLKDGWKSLRRGLAHAVPLLKDAGIVTSMQLRSFNAVVPLVVHLGRRGDVPLPADEAKSLVYWLLAASVLGRYQQASDTVIAQDALALRSERPLETLYRNLGMVGGRLTVTEEALVGRGSTSPYFLLSYLAAKRAGAKDWWYGVGIAAEASGRLALEYHHIHPRARLKDRYSKAEINDLANLAFISAYANRKIRDRSPRDYFPELLDHDADALRAHFVPSAEALRDVDRYPDLVAERRHLLAAAMTELLDSYRPSWLVASTAIPDPAENERLIIDVYADASEAAGGQVVLTAAADGQRWQAVCRLEDWLRLFDDLENGMGAELPIGDEVSAATIEDGAVRLPLGPLLVSGQLQDWLKVRDRELGERQPLGSAPATEPTTALVSDPPRPFSVLDSE